MAEYTDEELYDLSDEDLEKAFKEAKAGLSSPETEIEEESTEEVLPAPEMEEVDDLEQPEEDVDSDDDTSSDDEDVDESDESSETEEDDLDGDSDEEDEESTEDEIESEAKEQPVQDSGTLDEFFSQKSKVRSSGKDYEFTNKEKLEMFDKIFPQAENYTRKTQAIKPWRKTIDAIEQAELSAEDINLAIDVLKGDKDAISELLKRTGTDALELDVENAKYQPKDYGRNETELTIKDIVDEIKDDEEYKITYDVLERQWDAKSREEFVKDPEMIRLLHVDVKSGLYDTLSPIANKLKVYDNGKKSDLEYYWEAAKYHEMEKERDADLTASTEAKAEQKNEISRVKAETKKRTATKAKSAKRKAAAPTKKAAGVSKVTDYLDDSDESYDEWYKKLQDSI